MNGMDSPVSGGIYPQISQIFADVFNEKSALIGDIVPMILREICG